MLFRSESKVSSEIKAKAKILDFPNLSIPIIVTNGMLNLFFPSVESTVASKMFRECKKFLIKEKLFQYHSGNKLKGSLLFYDS